jgi:hypothetical protein
MTPEIESQNFPEHNPFGFTEREKLFDRISHPRLISILENTQTVILKAEVNSNNFGEFLFVSTRRRVGEKPIYVTFWGLGFHEYRERWLDKEWSWYESAGYGDTGEQGLTREDAIARINERKAEIASEAGTQTQSARARLYEMLADFTDEDGALAELEDLGDLLDDEDFLP